MLAHDYKPHIGPPTLELVVAFPATNSEFEAVCPSHSKVSKVLMGMLDQLHSFFTCWYYLLGAIRP
jgi:hypothetical protein